MTSQSSPQAFSLNLHGGSNGCESAGNGLTGEYTPAAWPSLPPPLAHELDEQAAPYSSLHSLGTTCYWPHALLQNLSDDSPRRSHELRAEESTTRPDTTSSSLRNPQHTLEALQHYYYSSGTGQFDAHQQHSPSPHVQRKCHETSNNETSDDTYIIASARRPSAAAATAVVAPPDSTTMNTGSGGGGTPTSFHLTDGPDNVTLTGGLSNRKYQSSRCVSVCTTGASGNKLRKQSLKASLQNKSTAASLHLRRQSCLAVPTTTEDNNARVSASVVFAAAAAAAAAAQQQAHSFYNDQPHNQFYTHILPSFSSKYEQQDDHHSCYPPPDYSHLRQRHNKQVSHKTQSASPGDLGNMAPPNVTITPGFSAKIANSINYANCPLPGFSSIMSSKTPPIGHTAELQQYRRHSMAVHASANLPSAAAARRFSNVTSFGSNRGALSCETIVMLGSGVDDDEDTFNKHNSSRQQNNSLFFPPTLHHSLSVPSAHPSWTHRLSSHDESQELGSFATKDNWNYNESSSEYGNGQNQQSWQQHVENQQQQIPSYSSNGASQHLVTWSADLKDHIQASANDSNARINAFGNDEAISSLRTSYSERPQQQLPNSDTHAATLPHLAKLLWGNNNNNSAPGGHEDNIHAVAQQTLHDNNMSDSGANDRRHQQLFQRNPENAMFDEITAQLSHQFRLSRSPSTSWIDRTAFSNIVDFIDDPTNTANQHHQSGAFPSDLSQLTFSHHHDSINMFADAAMEQHQLLSTDDDSRQSLNNLQQVHWRQQIDAPPSSSISVQQQTLAAVGYGVNFTIGSYDGDSVQNFGSNTRCGNATADILVPVASNAIREITDGSVTHTGGLSTNDSLRRQSSGDSINQSMHYQQYPTFADEWHQAFITPEADKQDNTFLLRAQASFPILSASLTQSTACSVPANLHEALVSSSTSSLLSPTTTTRTSAEGPGSENNSGTSNSKTVRGGRGRSGGAKIRKPSALKAARDARKDIAVCRGVAMLRGISDVEDVAGDEEDLAWLCTTTSSNCAGPVTTRGSHLWEFIRDILLNPKYCPKIVKWENREEGVFRFVESEAVAKMWGNKKCNPRMTYEKLSRAMRTYYSNKILVPVPKTGRYPKKLVYKFGPNSFGWQQASS